MARVVCSSVWFRRVQPRLVFAFSYSNRFIWPFHSQLHIETFRAPSCRGRYHARQRWLFASMFVWVSLRASKFLFCSTGLRITFPWKNSGAAFPSLAIHANVHPSSVICTFHASRGRSVPSRRLGEVQKTERKKASCPLRRPRNVVTSTSTNHWLVPGHETLRTCVMAKHNPGATKRVGIDASDVVLGTRATTHVRMRSTVGRCTSQPRRHVRPTRAKVDLRHGVRMENRS